MDRILKDKKELNTGILIMVHVVIMLLVLSFPIHAAESTEWSDIEMNLIMVTDKEISAREEPSQAAKAVFIYGEGDAVFVTGLTADGWYVVSHQDKKGYVRQEELKEIAIDEKNLEMEFKEMEEEGVEIIEEVERVRAEQRRSRIWGIIIVVLILAIFTAGIVSTLQSRRVKNEDLEE